MGHPISEKTKQKISEKAKIRWANPEFKTRMSGIMKDSIAERGCSKETRAKLSRAINERLKNHEYRKQMSENSKKKWQDPKYREHQSEVHRTPRPWRLGFKFTLEAKKKMSKSHIGIQARKNHPMYGKKQSKEAIEKMRLAHVGVPLSRKHKKKIGEASKRVWAITDEVKKNEWRKKIGDGNKGKIVSDEARKKISIAHKGKRHSPTTEFKKGMKHSSEHLEYISKVMKSHWKNQKYVKKMAKALHVTPNKPEIFLLNFLNNLYPGEWKFTGDFSFMINGKCPDFVNCNGQKKIIELFGDYWHKGEDPQDRANIFEPFGYDTLVIWEHELSNMTSLKQKLEAFCSNKFTPPYRKEVVDNG